MVVTENQWMFSPEEKLKRKQQKNKKHFIPEPIYPFFKFFASLQLAVPTILTLMIVLAAGTILESLEGAQAAKILIYDTWWFSLILFFLGFNVFMVTIDRIPWQKKHTGFLITHLGIIIVLVGSFITQAQMIDGQMQVEENDGESFVTLPGAPLVYVLDRRRINKTGFILSNRKH
jgi:magnesium-transporting ATPase (P-type)